MGNKSICEGRLCQYYKRNKAFADYPLQFRHPLTKALYDRHEVRQKSLLPDLHRTFYKYSYLLLRPLLAVAS